MGTVNIGSRKKNVSGKKNEPTKQESVKVDKSDIYYYDEDEDDFKAPKAEKDTHKKDKKKKKKKKGKKNKNDRFFSDKEFDRLFTRKRDDEKMKVSILEDSDGDLDTVYRMSKKLRKEEKEAMKKEEKAKKRKDKEKVLLNKKKDKEKKKRKNNDQKKKKNIFVRMANWIAGVARRVANAITGIFKKKQPVGA